MRIDGERESDNVEDQRSNSSGGGRLGGSGKPIGIGTLVLALAASYVFNINPLTAINALSGGANNPSAAIQPTSSQNTNDPLKKFVRVVMAQTEDAWTQVFKEQGRVYQTPKLVMFSGHTQTACGPGDTATGPFYCPADQKVYIDPNFYQVLDKQLGAPGDFAKAYVIGHEVGHHVQNLLGIMTQMEAAKRKQPKMTNPLSVRLELQADCFAGVWAKRTELARKVLEPGDLEEAIRAASAVGDDALQGTRAKPETFTHGTSAQRMDWFKRGFQGGNMTACNTFTGV